MSLPSSGQISLNNFRTEFSQSALNYYYFVAGASIGYVPFDGACYSPINVHSGNSGKYATSDANDHFSYWYGYNHTLNYSINSSETFRPCGLSITPYGLCAGSSMIIFDAGTSNQTLTIRISGSSSDFSNGYVESLFVYYGKPWANDGTDFYANPGPANPWGTNVIYSASYGGWVPPGYNWFTNGFDHEFDYNYVYDSNKGQYIYCVVYAYCP